MFLFPGFPGVFVGDVNGPEVTFRHACIASLCWVTFCYAALGSLPWCPSLSLVRTGWLCWEEQIHLFANTFKGIYNVTQDVTLIDLAKVDLKRKEPQTWRKTWKNLHPSFFCVFKVVFLVHGVLQRCNDWTCHLVRIKMGEVSEPWSCLKISVIHRQTIILYIYMY